MSEQNNNEIEIMECGVCYESKSDFTNGLNCTHRVCDDCSVRLTRCPFCRKAWREEDEESEEDEEEESEEDEDEPWHWANDIPRAINNLRRMYRITEQQMWARGEHHPEREATEQLMLIVLERIEELKNSVRYQVRTDAGFIYDNGECDFTTEARARQVFDNAREVDANVYYQLTMKSAFSEDDWGELFEGDPYPEVITIEEWNRLYGGDNEE